MTNILFALALAVWFALLSPVALRGLAVAAPVRNDPLLPPLVLVLLSTCLPYLISVPREDGTAVLDQGLSGSNMAMVAITGLTALYVLARVAADRRVLLLPFGMPYLPFTLMLGWDMLSAAWSIIPTYTAYRAAEAAAYFVATLLAFDRSSVEERLPGLLAAIIGAWLLTVAPTVLDGLAHGIVFSAAKNNLMPLPCAAVILLCLFRPGTARRRWLGALGVAGFVIAGSASSAAALLAALPPAMLIASRRPGLRATGGVLAVATLGVFTVMMFGLSAFPALVDVLSAVLQKPAVELANATGRDTIWPVFLAATRDHMIGSGYSAADRFVQLLLPVGGMPDELGRDRFNFQSAHNMFLSAWAGTGVIGLCFTVLVLGTTLAWGLKLDRAGRRAATAFTLMLIYNGLTTPGIFQDWNHNTLAFAAMLAFIRVSALGREGAPARVRGPVVAVAARGRRPAPA